MTYSAESLGLDMGLVDKPTEDGSRRVTASSFEAASGKHCSSVVFDTFGWRSS